MALFLKQMYEATLTEILKTFRPFKSCSLVQPDDGGDVVQPEVGEV